MLCINLLNATEKKVLGFYQTQKYLFEKNKLKVAGDGPLKKPKTQVSLKLGARQSFVVSPAPTILHPRVWIPIELLFLISILKLECEKNEKTLKRGRWPIFKKKFHRNFCLLNWMPRILTKFVKYLTIKRIDQTDKNVYLGGSTGLVVMGGDSRPRGRGIESQYRILDGHFFTLNCCKNWNVCLKKPKLNDKRGWDCPFFKKCVLTYLAQPCFRPTFFSRLVKHYTWRNNYEMLFLLRFVELGFALLIWSNPNQSNRRSVIQWYFSLWWVFSGFSNTSTPDSEASLHLLISSCASSLPNLWWKKMT